MLTLLLSAGFAGCLDDTGPAGAGGATLPFDPEGFQVPATYHFSDGWGLSQGEPVGDTRRANLGDFYTKWAVGSGFPQWSSAPLVDPMVVHGDVVLEFWVGTDTVVTSTPGIFPDFVVYFGSTDSVLSVVSPTKLNPVVEDFSVIMRGQPVLVRAEFAVPPGGITIPSGSGLRVVTAPVMMENDATDLYVLYGSPDYPSRVSFTKSNTNDDPAFHVVDDERSEDHVLTAGTFLHGTEIDDTTIYTESVEVTDNHTGFLVDLDFTGATPFPDMDLYVLAPDGSEVALSVTPGADESVHLYRRNLEAVGPGTWSIKVVNYVTVNAEFTLSWRLLEAPAPAGDSAA